GPGVSAEDSILTKDTAIPGTGPFCEVPKKQKYPRTSANSLPVICSPGFIWSTRAISLRLVDASCFVPIFVSHETLGVWYQAHGGNDAPNGSGQKSLRHTRFRTTAVPSLSVMTGLVPGAFV